MYDTESDFASKMWEGEGGGGGRGVGKQGSLGKLGGLVSKERRSLASKVG